MEIRTYEPELATKLLRFLEVTFPGTVKADPAYFQWKFGQNPLGSSLDAGRGCYIALDNGEVVAQAATMADRLELDGSSIPCAWVVDLVVAPDYRGQALATDLIDTTMQHHDVVLATGMAPRPAGLFAKKGFRRVPGAELTTVLLVVHPSRTLSRRRPWARAAVSLLDRPLERYRRATAGRPTDATVEHVEAFDAEVDALVDGLRPSLGATTNRSSRLYQWRFGGRPFAIIEL